ncbi:uncharacterized protein DUF695 [Fluviicoccus keumensis]|uniref:Uncharacterized protein DUF695 n=1 Tax=Fluviicoccus keumensis TaxID=1435465 RepID=A0A4Q7YI14_9GAMM|nr:DUF695 domain-containing protein [Fluviicoccus keumensis]RZU37067.1 uncharacterized protein DUF695 [Fluviicoccus keumensis]
MEQEWLTASADFEDGTKKIYSVRQHAPAGADPDAFSTVVVIEWIFEDQLPDQHLLQEMQAFQELLDPLDDAEESFLVHIITGDGQREWCYYTRSYPRFIQRMNKLLAGHKHYPLDIEYQEHTDWEYWEEIREYVQEGAEG